MTFTRAPVAPVMSTSMSGRVDGLVHRVLYAVIVFALSQADHRHSAPFMIVLRSLKSRLTSPGLVMSSVMPFIALTRTSSATLKAGFSAILGRAQ